MSTLPDARNPEDGFEESAGLPGSTAKRKIIITIALPLGAIGILIPLDDLDDLHAIYFTTTPSGKFESLRLDSPAPAQGLLLRVVYNEDHRTVSFGGLAPASRA